MGDGESCCLTQPTAARRILTDSAHLDLLAGHERLAENESNRERSHC